jgi:hypothetical protein
MREGIKIDSFHLEDMTINVYDKAAVATYIVITKGKTKVCLLQEKVGYMMYC